MKKQVGLILLCFASLSFAGTFQLLNPKYNIYNAGEFPSHTGDQLRVGSNGVAQVPYVLADGDVFMLRAGLSHPNNTWEKITLSKDMQDLLNNESGAALQQIVTDTCGNFYAFIRVPNQYPKFRVFRYTPSVKQWVSLNPTSSDIGYKSLASLSPTSGALRDTAGNILLLGSIDRRNNIVRLNCYSGRNTSGSTPNRLRSWSYVGSFGVGAVSVKQMYHNADSSWRYFVMKAANNSAQLYYSQMVVRDSGSISHRWNQVTLPDVGAGMVIRHILTMGVEDKTGKALAILEADNGKTMTVSLWQYAPRVLNVRETASWKKEKDLFSHKASPSGGFSAIDNKASMVVIKNTVYFILSTFIKSKSPKIQNPHQAYAFQIDTEQLTPISVVGLNLMYAYKAFNAAGHPLFYFGPHNAANVYRQQGHLASLNSEGTEISIIPGDSNAFRIQPIDGLLPSTDLAGNIYLMAPALPNSYKIWRYTPGS